MAEGGGSANTDPSKTLCRYFISGACRMGTNCQFSHDRSDKTSSVCRYYLRGACSYGDQCRYDHVKPSRQEKSKLPDQSPSIAVAKPPLESSSSSSPWSAAENATVFDDNDFELGLVSLKDMAAKSTVVQNSKLRADAKEFVPSFAMNNGFSPPSYAHAVAGSSMINEPNACAMASTDLLCPYHIMGECVQGDACNLIHGDICDLCNRPVLYPNNPVLNAEHRQECMADHEREMEFAFAVAKGDGKQCGICMEIVMEKTELSSRRFGILPACKHCFCLQCIRKWRRNNDKFENKVVRACPECRVLSDFVVPSTVWVEEEDEKQALLDAYHSSMKQKTCKYIQGGEVECPFGNQCFYRHVKPDGTVVEGDSPRTIRRRRQKLERDVFLLYDFLVQRFSDDAGDDEEDDWILEFELEQALQSALSLDSDSD